MSVKSGYANEFEIVIGCEVHAQIAVNSKLFSRASTEFGALPNTQVAFFDAAFPGMLPVVNQACVDQAILTGLALQAKINPISQFDRKNYFYPDLPSGYQISQFYTPIVEYGYLEIDVNGKKQQVRIRRLHLENDAGKSIHDRHPSKSYIDFNRCGVGLMEIVTEPDLRTSESAIVFIKELRNLLRWLGTCDGNMDEGSLRADVNVSVRRPHAELGTRVEVKNLNSIRFIGQAIEYEAERQIKLIQEGGQVIQETRLFDASTGRTRPMRSKEEAQDYRYFPDPDLPPLLIEKAHIDKLSQQLPRLPWQVKADLIDKEGVGDNEAALIAQDVDVYHYFVAAQHHLDHPQLSKLLANWIVGELFAYLNQSGLSMANCPISNLHFAELINLLGQHKISGPIAKEVFGYMTAAPISPIQLVREKGLELIQDEDEIRALIEDVFRLHADKVIEYHSGKEKLFGFFCGQAMKACGGRADPQLINRLLEKMLKR